MGKMKSLNRYQLGILVAMVVMTVVFAIVYSKVISKVGFEYQGSILVPREENDRTVYSGKVNGRTVSFIVFEDQTIEFHYENVIYGPYTVVQDSSAIPKGFGSMLGVELWKGDEILFRGGIYEDGDISLLYNEDGTINGDGIVSVVSGDGTVIFDEKGNRIDSMEPSLATLVKFLYGPELTHKGDRAAWFGGALICVMNVILILFAEELFRWKMAFRIRNVEDIEPSGLEIAGRYGAWTILLFMALAVYVLGLQ